MPFTVQPVQVGTKVGCRSLRFPFLCRFNLGSNFLTPGGSCGEWLLSRGFQQTVKACQGHMTRKREVHRRSPVQGPVKEMNEFLEVETCGASPGGAVDVVPQ